MDGALLPLQQQDKIAPKKNLKHVKQSRIKKLIMHYSDIFDDLHIMSVIGSKKRGFRGE